MERRDRISERSRVTSETKINLTFNVDGTGSSQLHSGIPFFDHILSGFAKHGIFDMTLNVEGDLEVDCHHTIEDTGIVLGEAIKEAVGDKRGIKRYGHFILPMDETLVLCAIDLSGRPYLSFEAPFTVDTLGSMDTEMVREFFYTVSYSAGMNLHLKVLTPGNNHHMAEALFKAFGKALDMASSKETRALKDEVMSTKGSL
ncbi:MAG: imidazoleglycerol-phosphate dehydratase HisB [Bariatricus massiliensis]|nr:imidazoleglycerol-phosphate dehydratase HisB [Bariatricus massiliensis]